MRFAARSQVILCAECHKRMQNPCSGTIHGLIDRFAAHYTAQLLAAPSRDIVNLFSSIGRNGFYNFIVHFFAFQETRALYRILPK